MVTTELISMGCDPRAPLTDYGWAPGGYAIFECSECKAEFLGDKRAKTCAPCAYGKYEHERMVKAEAERDFLRHAINAAKEFMEYKVEQGELDGSLSCQIDFLLSDYQLDFFILDRLRETADTTNPNPRADATT